MKIVCVFGDDTVNSYKRFSHIIDEIKKRGWEYISISPTNPISEVLASSSLFSTERLISVTDAQKISVKEYTWLSSHSQEHEGRLLLYFSASIPAAAKKLLPKDTVFEEFKLRKELFSFLETVVPNRGVALVTQFHEIIKTDAPELVLALLSRQIRDLAWVKTGGHGLTLPPWRMQKLTRQAQKFSVEQLTQFVSDLAEADIKSKTGLGELTLLLDLVFIKL